MLDERHWETPPREEVARLNLERVRAAMDEAGVDAIIVNRSDNLRYVTGVNPTDNIIFTNRQAAIVYRDHPQPTMFAASHYAHRVMDKFWIKDVRSLPRVQETWPRLFARTLAEYGVGPGAVVLLDPFMFYATSRLIERELQGMTVDEAGELLFACRAIKSPDEIAIIDAACSLGEISMEVGFQRAQVGITEVELGALMSQAALAAGAEGLYARRGTLVSSGEKLAHHMESPTRKRLRRGDFVLLDVGPMISGYYCDFARTLFLGDPTPEQVRIYRTAYQSLQAAIERMRPGTTGQELNAASQEVMDQAGYADHATPLVGHGVGVTAQEPPYVVLQEYSDIGSAEARDVVLRAGMILALSSGVFVPGVGGCRFEETVLVTDDGPRVLSRAPYPDAARML